MIDPTQRILPNDRLLINYIDSCCTLPITWDIDYSTWDSTNEIWATVYYFTVLQKIYIGP